MNGHRKRSWRNLAAAAVVLVPVVAVVVLSSFRVSDYECEVCMRFDGREVCRSAAAETEVEARRSAADNACAILTSGVTNTLRCTRSAPTRARCRALSPG